MFVGVCVCVCDGFLGEGSTVFMESQKMELNVLVQPNVQQLFDLVGSNNLIWDQ